MFNFLPIINFSGCLCHVHCQLVTICPQKNWLIMPYSLHYSLDSRMKEIISVLMIFFVKCYLYNWIIFIYVEFFSTYRTMEGYNLMCRSQRNKNIKLYFSKVSDIICDILKFFIIYDLCFVWINHYIHIIFRCGNNQTNTCTDIMLRKTGWILSLKILGVHEVR